MIAKEQGKYLVILAIGLLLIAVLEYINRKNVNIDDAAYLSLLTLMIIAITVSIHGLLNNYWVASIIGALFSFLPLFISLLVSPGKFGFSFAVPGLLMYFVSVYVMALLVGIPIKMLKK
jgi:hypothetical protein